MQITNYINGLQPIISNLSLHRYFWLINYYRKGARNSRNRNNKKMISNSSLFSFTDNELILFFYTFFWNQAEDRFGGKKMVAFRPREASRNVRKGADLALSFSHRDDVR